MLHRKRSGIELLPRSALIRTGPLDHADWNYRPLLRVVQRRRFGLCHAMLSRARYRRLLVVGYGSGVFLPSLFRRCDELYGIDVHEYHEEIERVLAGRGVSARLSSQHAERTSFPDRFFDAVVAISSIEFVRDIPAALREISRVLKPEGDLVVVLPGASRVLDLALRIMTGASARADYGRGRETAVLCLLQRFRRVRERRFPPLVGGFVPVYRAFLLRACGR